MARLIRSLAGEPRPHGSQKLTNREEWRIRLGDYRVLYTIDDQKKTVTVIRVKHRAKAYE
jgi:mRNA interferase RelE/StbE